MKARLVAALALVAALCALLWTARGRPDEGGADVRAGGGAAQEGAPAEGPTTAPPDPVRTSVDRERRPESAPDPGAGLRTAPRIRGRILDLRGRPIGGATVRLGLATLAQADDPPRTYRDSTTTDGDGAFAVDAWFVDELEVEQRPCHRLVVAADADGHWERRGTFALPPEREGEIAVELALPYEGAVAGRVVARDGSPVEGAEVMLVYARDARPVVENGVRRARTDDQGRFRIRCADGDGPRRVDAELEGVGVAVRSIAEPLPGGLEPTLDVGELVLVEHGVLAGRARLPDGTPAPGIELLAMPVVLDEASGRWRSTLGAESYEVREDGVATARLATDGQGAFRFSGLRRGHYAVLPVRNHRLWAELEAGLGPDGYDTAYPAGTTGIDLELGEALLVVEVRDAAGAAVPETSLWLRELPGEGPSVWEGVEAPRTEARFFVEPGSRHALLAVAEGHVPVEAEIELPPDAWEHRHRVDLSEPGGVGRVRLEVHGSDGERLDELLVAFESEVTRSSIQGLEDLEPDADGLLRDVPAGRYHVAAYPDPARYYAAARTAEPIEVRAGEEVLVALEARHGGAIEIALRLADDAELAELESLAGDGGHLPWNRLRRTPWTVSVLELGNDSYRSPSNWLDGEAWTSLDPIAPGPCRVRVEVAGAPAAERDVDVVAGRTSRVEVVLGGE